MPSNIADKTAADIAERDPTRSKGKGKAKDQEPDEDMEDDDLEELEEGEDEEEEEEEEDDDHYDDEEEEEEEDDDGMEKIDLENIQPRRTRGKRVDYTSAEALKKAGLDENSRDDDTEMQL